MKNILEINHYLTTNLDAILHGEIDPAPGDIDYFVNEQSMNNAVSYLREQGFTLTNINEKFGHYVFRRFENEGQLYIVDLMSDLNIMLKENPHFILTKEGSEYIGTDLSMYKELKNLIKKKIDICQFRNSFSQLFIERKYIKTFINKEDKTSKKTSMLKEKATLSWFYFSIKCLRYLDKIYSGKRVAFVGPDGSGKSFIIDKLDEIGRTENIYMGDWFFSLQGLYNTIKINIPTPYNRFVYLFYPPEQYIRTLKTYIWKFRGRIVLMDRFPGLNKNVSKSGLLGFFNKLNYHMYPKPDFIVHLWAPAEVIYKRKQELTVSEIANTNLHLEKQLADNRVMVDTTSLDEALNKILNKIYEGLK